MGSVQCDSHIRWRELLHRNLLIILARYGMAFPLLVPFLLQSAGNFMGSSTYNYVYIGGTINVNSSDLKSIKRSIFHNYSVKPPTWLSRSRCWKLNKYKEISEVMLSIQPHADVYQKNKNKNKRNIIYWINSFPSILNGEIISLGQILIFYLLFIQRKKE